MAKDKRFYYWQSLHEMLNILSDEDAGKYIKAIGRWGFFGEDTEFDDERLQFAWPFIRAQVAESVAIGIRSSEAGSRGGRPKSTNSESKKGVLKAPLKATLSKNERGAKRGAERGAESEEKGKEEKKETSSKFPFSDACAAFGSAPASSSDVDVNLVEDEIELSGLSGSGGDKDG